MSSRLSPRGSTTWAERQAIGDRAAAGQTDPQIAAALGWSVTTVRKWRRRGRAGETALRSVRGRPRCGVLAGGTPQRTMLREQVRTWRQAHPGWGPKTLRAELRRHPVLGRGPVPSRATLARFLKQEGLIPAGPRAVAPARPERPAPAAPHEEWELDARGVEELPPLGVVALVDLNDRYSHARLLSYPFLLGDGPAGRRHRHLGTADYQLALRLAFRDWGLPDRLQVDHEGVYCDPDSDSPFPTRLHLWLVALGVELCFTHVHTPTDQGMTERSHQLWDAQVLQGQRFGTESALFAALRERREFLNWHLPCKTLADRPPLVAYPEARCRRRWYAAEQEAALLAPERIGSYLDGKRWERKVSGAGTFRIGNQVYRLGKPWQPGSQVEIQHTATGEGAGRFLVRSEDGQQAREFAVQGCNPDALMGDLAQLLGVPGYQPALPFEWEQERVVRLYETLGVTSS